MKFERLRVLNISETDAGDNCLQILGMYCKDLRYKNVDNSFSSFINSDQGKLTYFIRELKVAHCMAITDAGIEGLCVSINRLGKEDQRLGQCKSIETLIIDGTSITKKGLETALLNLPFLKHLSTDLWLGPPVHFLAQMHQPDLNRKQLKDIRKYSLESLYLGNDTIDYPSLFHVQPDYTRGSLGLVASLCPLVTSVNIDLIAGLTDSEILGLLSLKSVNELGINGEYVRFRTVSFEGGIVPLLKGFGSSLKVLVLKAFLGDINVRAIIEFCPKLQSLKLNENNRYSTTVSFKEDAKPYHSKRSRIERKPLVLKNLEKLRVVRPYYVENAEAQVEEQISSEDLLCLISSPSLIDIEIRDCPNLTDCVFESASEIHQFLSLEKLTLFKCNSLTRKGIDVVMNNQTPLKTIDVRSCGNITDGDIALLISNARSEKWQLSVEYVNENGKRIKM
jgi:hypothetical protein